MNELSAESLVAPLIKATQGNTIRWEDDPTGGYRVRVGENTLNVYSSGGLWVLRVVNNKDDVVDWIEEGFLGRISELEQLARRQARKVDAVMTDILAHLGVAVGSSH